MGDVAQGEGREFLVVGASYLDIEDRMVFLLLRGWLFFINRMTFFNVSEDGIFILKRMRFFILNVMKILFCGLTQIKHFYL